MNLVLRVSALLTCILFNSIAFAQSEIFPSPNAATKSLFPNDDVGEWVSEEGDLNNDGVKDVAMIITFPREVGEQGYPLEKKVLVLAGLASGGYTLLSVSGTYCDAQKFYNLQISNASLFITEVHKADSNESVTNSLQYRYNKKYSDLELIGRENISESFEDKSYYRLSVNYLNGSSIEYEQNKGRAKTKKNTRFKISSLPRLNGFDCEKFVYDSVY